MFLSAIEQGLFDLCDYMSDGASDVWYDFDQLVNDYMMGKIEVSTQVVVLEG
jgi:hypothetical protein